MAYHCFYDYRSGTINLAAGDDASGYYCIDGGQYYFNKSVTSIFFNFIFLSGGNHALGSRTIVG